MDISPKGRRNLRILGLVLVLAGGGVAAYLLWPRPLPEPGSPKYVEYVRAFQVGVAALDAPARRPLAQANLDRAIELIPSEPAGWANRGLLYLRTNDLPKAERDLAQADKLAPNNGEIASLRGHLARQQGRFAEAAGYLRKTVEADPRDLTSIFLLADVISQEGKADNDREIQNLMERILAMQPYNLRALALHAQEAHRRKDQAALGDTLARLDRLGPGWTTEARKKLAAVHNALTNAPGEVEIQMTFLHNLLRGERGYQRDAGVLNTEMGLMGTPVLQFLALQQPRPTPAPPDKALAFTVGPWPGARTIVRPVPFRADGLQVVWSVDEKERRGVLKTAAAGGPTGPAARLFHSSVFLANGSNVYRADVDAPGFAFPGGAKASAPSPAGLLTLDWANDLHAGLVLAGEGGLRFWQQQPDGAFADVTARTALPADVLAGDYRGAWAADIESDGDLDIVVARRAGAPRILRNNRDATFTELEIKEFAALRDVRAFVWADLDNDGASDAVFLDAAGKLHVFANERHGQFTAWPLPATLRDRFVAVTAADINDDGIFDLVALREDGTLVRISDQEHRTAWQVADLAHGAAPEKGPIGAVTLHVEDLDNNGALDVIVAGQRTAQVFVADEEFRLHALSTVVPLRVCAVMDLDGDGRLDLLGLSAEGELVQARNTGTKNYHWQVLRPIANPNASGDDRNNSFGVGGEIEIRSGLLVQKQRITGPLVHFGLGEQDSVNVLRIVWPNGSPQWEFELPADPLLLAAQRLGGSCPFLFTYDGTEMRFAGDFMWNTPLGMSINGQTISSFEQTTEWLKIRGEHLVPKDGHYDLRVHANLGETDYFDQLGLIVVDHPPDTEIYVDERFFLTPTAPKLYVTTPVRPVARAWDHFGQDATDLVVAIDGRYLDRAGRGKYQGVTNDHWVEAELPDDAPTEGPVYLVARGWIHPTDSSINVALAQGKHDGPQPLVLEVPDGKGGWKVGRPALGFPAGKDKTILIRLDGIDGPGVSKRFRLRTNMEIFWDFLGYARGLDAGLAKLERPAPQSAELRYRGILEMTQKDASSPEVPHYDKVMRGIQPWRDLTGWYTRFGDVRELVAKVDDRYVIANAGDEIAFRFPVPAGPPPGWKRDFIWECDGWTRDGNPNTRFGTTVLPLPAHGLKSLDRPPGQLEDDPVYRLFPRDWETYHTRYVTPAEFERGLRTFKTPKR